MVPGEFKADCRKNKGYGRDGNRIPCGENDFEVSKMLFFGNIQKGLETYRHTPGALLVDVREADEFSSGHIPEAINLPLSSVHNASLPKERPLFLYCLRGSRSKRAEMILKRMGYQAKSIGGISSYKGPKV